MGKTWLLAMSLGSALFVLGACANNGGSCDPACGDSQACCGDTCVFTISDPTNCGMCGNACGAGQACTNGVCTGGTMDGGGIDGGPPPSTCTPECAASQRCCGGSCVDRANPTSIDGRTNNAFLNCNGCGIACDSMRALSCSVPGGGEGTPRCMCGDLDQCLPGDICVNQDGFWTCASTSTDPNNCGGVGIMCAEGESCSGGTCVCGSSGAACPSGQACCGGTCLDTSADPMNCGACGNSCTPNAPDCQAGSCTCAASGRACEEPSGGGGGLPIPIPGAGDLGESCCPSLGCVANSDDSCACTACTGEDECVSGTGLLGGIGGMGGSEVPTVCCGDPIQVGLLGCGGIGLPGFPGGDGGLPGLGDGGLPFP